MGDFPCNCQYSYNHTTASIYRSTVYCGSSTWHWNAYITFITIVYLRVSVSSQQYCKRSQCCVSFIPMPISLCWTLFVLNFIYLVKEPQNNGDPEVELCHYCARKSQRMANNKYKWTKRQYWEYYWDRSWWSNHVIVFTHGPQLSSRMLASLVSRTFKW